MTMSLLMITSLVLIFLPHQLHSQPSSDTTNFDFTVFDGKEADLIYQGDAHIPTRTPIGTVVPPGQTFIRLTNAVDTGDGLLPLRERVGRVLYSRPIRLWDDARRRRASFQTVFRGYIGNPTSRVIGDGIAFFIVPVNMTSIPPGSTAGNMGLYDVAGTSPVPLVAVELDVFPNTWDPTYRHLGINVNSRQSVVEASWDAGFLGRDVEAIITYDARRSLLSAFANASSPGFVITTRVEANLELKSILPEWVQIGISASTGEYYAGTAIHDIRGWSFNSFMELVAGTRADH